MKNDRRCMLFAVSLTLMGGCASLPAPSPKSVEHTPLHSGSYVREAETQVKPTPISTQEPIYPAPWRAQRVNGEAVTDFIIDERGVPLEVQILRASDQAFADSAVEAVKEWRFTPGLKEGRRARVRMEVPIVFHMDGTIIILGSESAESASTSIDPGAHVRHRSTTDLIGLGTDRDKLIEGFNTRTEK